MDRSPDRSGHLRRRATVEPEWSDFKVLLARVSAGSVAGARMARPSETDLVVRRAFDTGWFVDASGPISRELPARIARSPGAAQARASRGSNAWRRGFAMDGIALWRGRYLGSTPRSFARRQRLTVASPCCLASLPMPRRTCSVCFAKASTSTHFTATPSTNNCLTAMHLFRDRANGRFNFRPPTPVRRLHKLSTVQRESKRSRVFWGHESAPSPCAPCMGT